MSVRQTIESLDRLIAASDQAIENLEERLEELRLDHAAVELELHGVRQQRESDAEARSLLLEHEGGEGARA